METPARRPDDTAHARRPDGTTNLPRPGKWEGVALEARALVDTPNAHNTETSTAVEIPDPFAVPVPHPPDIDHGPDGKAAYAADYAGTPPNADVELVSDYFNWERLILDAEGHSAASSSSDNEPEPVELPRRVLFKEDTEGDASPSDTQSPKEDSVTYADHYPGPGYYDEYEQPEPESDPGPVRLKIAAVEPLVIGSSYDPADNPTEEVPLLPATQAPSNNTTDKDLSAQGPKFKDERGKLRRSLDYFRPSQWMAKAAIRKVAKNWDREASEVSGREVWEKVYTPKERKIFRWAEGIGGLYGVMALGTVAIKSIPSLRFIGEHLEDVGDWLSFDGQFGPGSGATPHFEHPSASPSGSKAAPSTAPHPGPNSSSQAPAPVISETPKSTTTTGGPKPTATGTTAPAPGATAGSGAAGAEEQTGGGTAGLGAAEEQAPTIAAIPEHIELTVENGGMHKGDGSWILSNRHLTEAAEAAGIDPDTLTNEQRKAVQTAFLNDEGNKGKFYGDGLMNLEDKDGNPIVYEGHDEAVQIASIIEGIKNGGNGQVVESTGTNANTEPNLQPNPNGQAVDTTVQGAAVPGVNEGRLEDVIINVENGDDWDAIFDKIDIAASAEERDKLIHDPRFQEVMGKSGFNIGYKEGNDYRVRMPHQGDNDTHPLPQGAVEEILDQYYRLLDEEEDEDATV
jgi:hypothetical protein